eukprot:TRINITY_DN66639_c3_g4_i4.p1 TRINITY_DN66639_c3_g4~~TRINITY_DN66639_c3_g4_i4.p1  ORF type:complete len:319 (-),score=24.31 TRINITY_DN66639_c3_g4_i4:252-1208(-)
MTQHEYPSTPLPSPTAAGVPAFSQPAGYNTAWPANVAPLPSSDPLYQQVSDLFVATAAGRPVVNIFQVENPPEVTAKWQQFKDSLPEAEQERETGLWHGSSRAAISNICLSSFKLPTMAGGMLGPGCYFAQQAEKACRHAEKHANNQVLLCKVLPGVACKVATAHHAFLAANNTTEIQRHYHSLWGHSFVTPELAHFRPEAALPQFVVEFTPTQMVLPIPIMFPVPASPPLGVMFDSTPANTPDPRRKGKATIFVSCWLLFVGATVATVITAVTYTGREVWADRYLTDVGTCRVVSAQQAFRGGHKYTVDVYNGTAVV